MKSMTGYGKGMVAGDDFSVSVDLKTVNNRFLDIHLRVGSELSSIEAAIKKRITSRLSRGRVDVNVSMERAAQIAYELNRPLIAGYVTALKQLQQDLTLPVNSTSTSSPVSPARSNPLATASTRE
jgi:large subunit ribosomal protein L28